MKEFEKKCQYTTLVGIIGGAVKRLPKFNSVSDAKIAKIAFEAIKKNVK